jgi:hypothetical protein
MTLAKRKTKAVFTTSTLYRGKALVVEAQPFFCTIRQKGSRFAFTVPWDAVYEAGAKIAARLERETK